VTKSFIGYARRRPLFVLAMLGLRSLAALFTLMAAFSFVRGLGRLFLFSGGILLNGADVLGSDLFSRRLGEATYAFFGPLLFGSIAGLCVAGARRMSASLTLPSQAADTRPPVVYLRSFQSDRRLSRRVLVIGRVFSWRTEEEQFVAALRESGPVVAIGRPGERLPRLGAQRVYVDEADWRQQIRSWFTHAALVAIHVPATPTEGLLWEIEETLDTVALERLVFLVPRGVSSLAWLNQHLRDRALPELHLKNARRAPYRSGISGIVHFVGGHGEFRPLVKPPFFRRPWSSPLVPVYRLALQPVTRHITGSWRRLAPAYGDALIATIWTALGLAVIAAAADSGRIDSIDREVWACGIRVASRPPPEALELAMTREQAARSPRVTLGQDVDE
jgi:hypothetical protein